MLSYALIRQRMQLTIRRNLTSLEQVSQVQTLLNDGLHEKRRGIVRQNGCRIAFDVCMYVCMYVCTVGMNVCMNA